MPASAAVPAARVAVKVLPSPVSISASMPWRSTNPPSSCTSKWRSPMVRSASSRMSANALATSSICKPRERSSRRNSRTSSLRASSVAASSAKLCAFVAPMIRDSRVRRRSDRNNAGMPVTMVSTRSSQYALASSRCGSSTGGGSTQGVAAAAGSDIEAPQEQLPNLAIKPERQRLIAVIEARIDAPAHLRDRRRRPKPQFQVQELDERLRSLGIAGIDNDFTPAGRAKRKTWQPVTNKGELAFDKAGMNSIDLVDKPKFDSFRAGPNEIQRVVGNDKLDDGPVERCNECQIFAPMGEFAHQLIGASQDETAIAWTAHDQVLLALAMQVEITFGAVEPLFE